jgi:ribosomal protein S18 acetylase RimI-like enzyme
VSLSLRPLEADDARAVADLIGDYDAFHNGSGDRPSEQDVLDWWARIDGGTAGAFSADGRLVGAASLRRRGDYNITDAFVHPDARGRGVATLLLDWAEAQTREAGLPAVRASASTRDAGGKALLERRGYAYLRSFYRMTIDLDEEPPPPDWPEGFSVALEPDQAEAIHETLEEAFADHWGFERRTFEEWMVQNGPLDDRLCYVVRTAEGEPAAAQVCDEERFGAGLVAILGVRPAWRRHGLGEALLRQAFHDLYGLGQCRVGLGVDAGNTTGATRLYERVGMSVTWQDDAYEKQLGSRD